MDEAITKELINIANRRTNSVLNPERLAFASGIAFTVIQLVSLAGSATLVVRQLFPVLALGTLLFEMWILLLSIALLRKL